MERCTNPQHHYSPVNQLCHEHTMAKIEKISYQRNIRLTSQRKSVIQLMLKAERAMSAYDLLDQLREIEPQAKPPTIYRALDFLMEQGFIHKVESMNSYIICPHFDDPSHISILLICNSCQQIIEEHCSPIENELQTLAKENTFKVQHSVLEIRGVCQKCQII
jgi:Fur family transcriptional regulator, zinc uptake regulator